MTEKYTLLIYCIHSALESHRKELKVTIDTTVENFRDKPENEAMCKTIFDNILIQWNYELSNNQMCNGINLFLQAWKNN